MFFPKSVCNVLSRKYLLKFIIAFFTGPVPEGSKMNTKQSQRFPNKRFQNYQTIAKGVFDLRPTGSFAPTTVDYGKNHTCS